MKQSAGKANNNVVVFAAGVVCAVVCMGAALWAFGVIDLGNTSAKADEIVADGDSPGHDGDTPSCKEIPEDTTDLGKLKVMELARYYHNAMMGKIKRNRDDIRAAVAKLTEEDIDLMCESFKNEPTGNGLTKYALVLSDVGTEKALRTLGTFYLRPDLKNSFQDFGISIGLGSTGCRTAEDILIEAFNSLEQAELRKAIAFGLARFSGNIRASLALMRRIPLAEEGECMILLGCLGMVGDDDGARMLKAIAEGEYNDNAVLAKIRSNAINAFRRSPYSGTVPILREIAFHSACQSENLQMTTISVLGKRAAVGGKEAVDVLCDIGLKEQKRASLFDMCLTKLSTVNCKDPTIRSSLQRLLRDLEKEELKAKVRNILNRIR